MLYKEDFGEGKNIEFKREIPKRHEKLLKDVIAFSNSTGGKIFIGIEDKTNEVIGIGEKNPFRLADDISNMIFDSCTPIIDPEITMISHVTVTALNIKTVIESFSGEEVFGRKEIKERLGYKDSKAGLLIEKMQEFELIKAVRGQGKGKYCFDI